MSDFSIETTELTDDLRDILDKYPFGGQILKELLQNAEDGCASELKFYLDYRSFSTSGLINENLDKFQVFCLFLSYFDVVKYHNHLKKGEALWAFNNGTFTEQDLKSIRKLKRSEKHDKPLKIGRFGLGFKSVYHLTDLPSLITGNNLIMLDPHMSYFNGQTGILFDFSNKSIRENYFKKYPNQFAPYLSVPCGPNNFEEHYNGTLFRFPMRNSNSARTSRLRNEPKSLAQLMHDELFQSFFDDLHLILLFLRYIKRIEIYEIENDVDAPKLLASTCIDEELSDNNLDLKRQEFNNHLNSAVHNQTKQMRENVFELHDHESTWMMTIRTKLANTSESIDSYLIANKICFKSASNEMQHASFKLFTLPICNIAYKLNSSESKTKGRYFCYLPLPSSLDPIGLNIHMNASFSLKEDRRDFKWYDCETKEDVSYKWNDYLCDEVLVGALLMLITHAKTLVSENRIKVDEFYGLIPNMSEMNFSWKTRLQLFFTRLLNESLIYSHVGWIQAKDTFILRDFLVDINDINGLDQNKMKNIAIDLVNGQAVLDLPQHTINFFDNSIKMFEIEHLLAHLKETNNSFDAEERKNLLMYLLHKYSLAKHQQLIDLHGIELLPLESNQWIKFDSSSNSKKIIIFEHERDYLMMKSDETSTSLFKYDLFQDKIKTFIMKNLVDQASFYQIQMFNRSFFIESLNKLEKSHENILRIWNYIYTECNDSLVSFESFKLIPFKTECLALDNNLVKYFLINEENVYPHLIQFFTKYGSQLKDNLLNGLIFFKQEDLPFHLVNHPRRQDYIKNINLESYGFLQYFQVLRKLFDNEFDKLLKDNLTNECIKEILELLRKVTCINVCDSEFIKLHLPIFKVLNDYTNSYYTSNECSNFIMPKSFSKIDKFFDEYKLPVSLKIIICDDHLANVLGLIEYPEVTLVGNILKYFMEKSNLNSIKILLSRVFENNQLFYQKEAILKLVINSKVFEKDGQLKCINELYDPHDEIIQRLVPASFHLSEYYTEEPFYSKIKSCLKTKVEVKMIEEFLKLLENNQRNTDDMCFFLKFLQNSSKNTRDDYESIVRSIKWLARNTNYPLKDSPNQFNGLSLYSSKLANLIYSQCPIACDQISFDLYEYLGIVQECELDNVIKHYYYLVEHNRTNIDEISCIYDYFIQNNTKIENRLNLTYVFDGISEFFPCEKLVINADIDLCPYLIPLKGKIKKQNDFITKYEYLYTKIFNIKQHVDLDCLLKVLNIIKNDQKCVDSDLKIIKTITEYIANDDSYLCVIKANNTLELPTRDELNNIQFTKLAMCTYFEDVGDDLFELSEETKVEICSKNNLKIVDTNIVSIKVLKKLGVCSFNKSFDGIEDYQQEENLTQRLKKLLVGYTEVSLFKEMIQNADDAKASRVTFCYDARPGEEFQLLGRQLTQTLWIHNDSVFSDQDFINIRNLGSENKMQTNTKIGKFGVGFNAVYNFTDVPSILSRDTLIIFDPNRNYLKEGGKKIDFSRREDLCDKFKIYQNEDLFGCKMYPTRLTFNGTLIRLPLRLQSSSVSFKTYKDTNTITDILNDLCQSFESLLEFTMNVCMIKFCTINEDGSIENIFELRKSTVRHLVSHNSSLNFLEASAKLRSSNNSTLSSISLNKYEINSNTSQTKFNLSVIKSEKYFITSNLMQIGQNELKLFENDVIYKSLLPIAGIVIELDKVGDEYHVKKKSNKHGLIYTFLPLGMRNNLNFNTNGCFIVTEDRQHLYDGSNATANELKFKWNQLIMKVLSLCLVHTIEAILREKIRFSSYNLIIQQLWPNNLINQNLFKIFEETFYGLICNLNGTHKLFNDSFDYFTFAQCSFIDFNFEHADIQAECVSTLRMCNLSTKIIDLPREFMQKLRLHADSSKLITDISLLNILIAHKLVVDRAIFNKIIKYLINLRQKKLESILKNNDCIEASNAMFKSISNLYYPSVEFKVLFDDKDGLLPSECFTNDSITLKNLCDLGLRTSISYETLLNCALSIKPLNQSDHAKAMKRSQIIVNYCNKSVLNEHNLNELRNIEFIFAKESDSRWPFNTYAGDKCKRIPLKPNDLFHSSNELIIGCVCPIFDKKFYGESRLIHDINEHTLIRKILEQISVKDNFNVKETLNLSRIEQSFKDSYVYLSKYAKKDEKNIEFIQQNLPRKWIFLRDKQEKLLDVESIAFKVSNEAEPYIHSVPYVYHDSHELFSIMKVPKLFSAESLICKLNQIKNIFGDSPLDEITFQSCLKITNEIDSVANSRPIYEEVQLPDENKIMRKSTELCVSDNLDHLSSDTEIKLFLIHDRISPATIKSFSITNFNQTFAEMIGEPFGQREELTDRIKTILDKYSTNVDVFKELVQNADDSDATEVKFILDTRYLKTTNTFSECYNELQGPALCCWNNATFQECDFVGISQLGRGSKREDGEKIGKFGVGFNTVYHFTDAPQFISNNFDYVILDPLCKFFPCVQKLSPGRRIKKANQRLVHYTDVLSGFQIPGIPLEGSTLFRLALRRQKGLTDNFINLNQMRVLFGEIKHEIGEFMLFLKNVRTIGFYELNDKSELRELFKAELEAPNLEKVKEFDEHFKRVHRDLNKVKELPFKRFNYKLKLILTECNRFRSEIEYLRIDQIGIDDVKQLDDFKSSDKHFPYAAICYNLTKFYKKPSTELAKMSREKIFCFLPLNQYSPFNFHVNGYFALDNENRRCLFNSSSVSQNAHDLYQAHEEISIRWNKLLINEIVCPLFIELIIYLQPLVVDHDQDLKKYMNLFKNDIESTNSNNDFYFKEMLTNFYSSIYANYNVIPIDHKINDQLNLKWFKPSDPTIAFSRPVTCSNRDEVIQVLIDLGMNVCTHDKFVNLFKNHAKKDLKLIDGTFIINSLKNNARIIIGQKINDSKFKSIKILFEILEFCKSSSKDVFISNLHQCPILLSADETIENASDKKLFQYHEPEIFKNRLKEFIHTRFIELFEETPYVKLIDIQALTYLLPNIIDAKLYKSQPQKFDPTKYPKMNILEKKLFEYIWLIIENDLKSHKNLINYLECMIPLSNWHILPVKHQDKSLDLKRYESNDTYLAPIRDSKFILNSCDGHILTYTIKSIGLPRVEYFYSFNSFTRKIIDSITASINVPSDVLNLFYSLSLDQQDVFQQFDCKAIINYFNKECLELKLISKNNLYYVFKSDGSTKMDDSTARHYIQSLPIFIDIFKNRTSLKNFNAIFTCTGLPSAGLKEFCEIKNYKLMEMEYNSALYKYLSISERTFELFYTEFIPWLNQNYPNYLFGHIQMLVHSQQGLFLKDIPFLIIKSQQKYIKDLYDPRLYLFNHGFDDEYFPPAAYHSNVFLDFFIKCGLRAECSKEDCVYLAQNVIRKFKATDVNRLIEFVIELLNAIQENFKDKGTEFIQNISTIRFIPSFVKKKDFSGILTATNTNFITNFICLKGSVIEKIKNLVCLTHDYVPKVFLDSIKKENLSIFGIIDKVDCELVMKNLINLAEKCPRNLREVDKLEAILIEIYEYLSTRIKDEHIETLRDIPFVLRCVNRSQIEFNKACQFTMRLNSDSVIYGYLYKLPHDYSKFSSLFEKCGCTSTPSLNQCHSILVDFRSRIDNDFLDPNELIQVLKVIKLLIAIDVSDYEPKLEFYFPNCVRQLKSLRELYYIDRPSYQHLLQSSDEVREMCLFNIQDLTNLDWTCTFETSTCFRDCKPRALSNYLEKKLIQTNNEVFEEDSEMLLIINHEKLFESFVCLLNKFNPQPTNRELLKSVLENMKLLLSDKLLLHYVYKESKRELPNSAVDEDFFMELNENNEMIIYRNETSDIYEYYTFLAECLWDRIIDQTLHETNMFKIYRDLAVKITIKLFLHKPEYYDHLLEKNDIKATRLSQTGFMPHNNCKLSESDNQKVVCMRCVDVVSVSLNENDYICVVDNENEKIYAQFVEMKDDCVLVRVGDAMRDFSIDDVFVFPKRNFAC